MAEETPQQEVPAQEAKKIETSPVSAPEARESIIPAGVSEVEFAVQQAEQCRAKGNSFCTKNVEQMNARIAKLNAK